MTAAIISPMPTKNRTYEREAGKKARAAILEHLREHETATTRELAAIVGLSQQATHLHAKRLRDGGFVHIRTGRNGGVGLTEAGRIVLDD